MATHVCFRWANNCIALFVLATLALATLALATPLHGQENELTEERFRELHRQLQPSDDDLWRSIPWRTSVLKAQHVAAEENKPIFIWAMDGHPLGCT